MLLHSPLSSLIHILLIIIYYCALHSGKAQQEEMRMEHSPILSKSQTNLQSGLEQTVPCSKAGDVDVNPVGISPGRPILVLCPPPKDCR